MNALLGSSLLQSIAAPLDFNLLRDYCADVGITRTPSRTELLYARQHVVTAAVANGVQAIDLVCVEYTNDQVLQEECLEVQASATTLMARVPHGGLLESR